MTGDLTVNQTPHTQDDPLAALVNATDIDHTTGPGATVQTDQSLSLQKGPFWTAVVGVLLIVFLFWSKPPFGFGFDPNDEKCIPDMHLSFMVRTPPRTLKDDDIVFWKPVGPLAYVKQEFVMKQVGGVAGDHLVIHGDKVFINGKLKVSGLALASLYHRTPAQLERDEVIPAGKIFVIGQHPHSDDSRYWGYLDTKVLEGYAFKLL